MLDNITITIVALSAGLGTLVLVSATAFTKLSIVFFIIRNALGLQQAPSNMVLHTLALVLTIYITLPVITETYGIMQAREGTPDSADAWFELFQEGSQPIKKFLLKNTEEVHKDYFVGVTKEIWKGSELKAGKEDFVILVPSFMITELTRAFEIGFLLYLPFVAIDIVLTTILMAMGMMMVPPTIISVPFKLLLFVMIGGWTKLVQGLVLTYAA